MIVKKTIMVEVGYNDLIVFLKGKKIITEGYSIHSLHCPAGQQKVVIQLVESKNLNLIHDENRSQKGITPEIIQEFLAMKIIDLDLNVRTRNCLLAAEINSVEQLTEYVGGRRELLKFRNFGKRGLTEIENLLAPYGLKLKDQK